MSNIHFVFWHWFAFAAVLGTLEILAPGIFFLWLALASFVTGVIVLVVPEISAALQITLFSILSLIMVYAAWKFLKKNPITSDQPLLNQRAAQFVGKVYALEDAIVNGTGRVRIGDSTWKVEGPDMAAGASVRVTGFDGPVLTVEKVSDGNAAAPHGHSPAGSPTSSPTGSHDPRIDPIKDTLQDPLNNGPTGN